MTRRALQHLDVIPLGGFGEIGKNMMAVEFGGDLIMIDAGLAFPEDEMLGVDIVIPDISYFVERQSMLRAIILTHGHEDHIGALPYVLRELVDVPLYGTRLTLGLVSRKLAEHGIDVESRARVIRPGDELSLGSLTLKFFRVLHSIADTVGLAIHSPIGTIVHSGDFKFDQTPIDGHLADYSRLAEFGDRGVLALLSDSTNAEIPGYTPSERVVGLEFDRLFAKPGRILVACFASNVPRMQQVVAATVRHNRRLAVMGRSMENVLEVAMTMGYLEVPDGVLVGQDELDRVPQQQLVVLTTGTQGEPMSALTRMAAGEHRRLVIGPDDTIIISASAVPGNEKMVNRTIDNLLRLGATVIHQRNSAVHVSGHASQEELKLMINLVRPRFFVPIHGQYRHMIRHAELARELGIPAENVLIGDNGTVFRFTSDGGEIAGRVTAGNVLVDGLGVGDVGNVVLRDRRQLSQDGIVVVVLTVNERGLVNGPEVVTRGFVYVKEAEELIEASRELIRGLCRSGHPPSKARLRDALSKYLFDRTGRRPMILPIVQNVGLDQDVTT